MTQSNPNADPSNPHAHIYEVGWMFVREYYKYLNNEPGRLHCFYAKDSMSQHGYEGESIVAACSQQEIYHMFEKLKYQNCRVFISNVDSQPSRDGGVLVQVLGEMSNNGQPSQKFVQTFFLAKQPKGYYILNDILRFLEEEVESEVEVVEDTLITEKSNLMEDHSHPQHHHQHQHPQQQHQQQLQRGSAAQPMELRRDQMEPVVVEKTKPAVRAKSPEQQPSVAQATATPTDRESGSPLRATSPKKTRKSKSRSPKRSETATSAPVELVPTEENNVPTPLVAPPAPSVPEKPKETVVVPAKPTSWAAMVQTVPPPSTAAATGSSVPGNVASGATSATSGSKPPTASRTTSPPVLSSSTANQSTKPGTSSGNAQHFSSSQQMGYSHHHHHHHHHHPHQQQQQQQQRGGGSHTRSQTGGSSGSGGGGHSRMEGGSYRGGNGGHRRESDLDPQISVYVRCYASRSFTEKDIRDAFKDIVFKRIEAARQGAVCYLTSMADVKALIGKVVVVEGNQMIVKSQRDSDLEPLFEVEPRKKNFHSGGGGSGGPGGNKNNGGTYQRPSRPSLSSSSGSHPQDRSSLPRGNNSSSAGHLGRNNHHNPSSSGHHHDGGMGSGMMMSGGGGHSIN